MHPLVNHLIQLQELGLIREEQKIAGASKNLEQLDESIQGLRSRLPDDMRGRYERLSKRDPVVIVPVHNGHCAGCGMQLPISLVQAVRMAREIESCPNCAHLLYQPEETAQRFEERARRGEPRKVGISRFSSHTLMIPKLDAGDMEGAIRELATKMEQEGFVSNSEHLVQSALRREAIVSTAVDHGLAFPHVRGVEGGGLAFSLGISRTGIKFNGPNSTHMIFFIVIPTAASAFYLKLLAGLAETFTSAEARKSIMAEKESDKLWKALAKVTRATIK